MRRSYVIAVLLSALVIGCQNQSTTRFGQHQTSAKDPRRDTDSARRLNAEAVKLLSDDQAEEAEKKLKAALSADLFFGPAHNNLGTLYHRQEKYYQAAWEFQYAARLMPGKAKPKNNLGMVFEAVGRLDESAKWYEEALAIEPDNVEITGNLARVMIQTDRRSNKIRKLLSDIVMKDHRPEWVAWAREQLALIGQPETTPTPGEPGPDQ